MTTQHGETGGRPPVTPRQAVRARRGFREWPILVVCVGVAAGLAYMGMNHFKRGSMIVAICVCGAAFLRLVLPQRAAGLLAVRGRIVDVIALTALGVAIAIITYIVPPPG
ncbi:MAG: DUF3017 domain-containing protein [Streptosporangiales bacterium]|nr:DUF3017 domain-containing protein [Streptosporangiales bacterium]